MLLMFFVRPAVRILYETYVKRVVESSTVISGRQQKH